MNWPNIYCDNTTTRSVFQNFNKFRIQFEITATRYIDLEKFDLSPSDIDEKIASDAVNDVIKINKVCACIVAGGESDHSFLIYEILKNALSGSGCGDAQLKS